jgi:hypothetical protein
MAGEVRGAGRARSGQCRVFMWGGGMDGGGGPYVCKVYYSTCVFEVLNRWGDGPLI